MRIVIFGASGGVGRKCVELALSEGHQVKAVYRQAAKGLAFSAPSFQAVVGSDWMNLEFISKVIEDADAVVSAIGLRRKNSRNPWSSITSPTDLTSRFADLVDQASRQVNFKGPVVAVSAAGVGDSWDRMHPIFRVLFRCSNVGVAYEDLDRMENKFKSSPLDWVCVRPTTLTNGPLTKQIRLVSTYGLMNRISRSDVAWYMLQRILGRSPEGSRTPMLAN